MSRTPLDELRRRCLKPDSDRTGNWMARRVSRPAALRVTWLVANWRLSANTATLAAWACGVGAAIAMAWGSMAGWLAAAGLLHLWYLLDHVDGQLARLHKTASLDGVQLDYLMHHTINLLVPLGAGWGLFVRRFDPVWAAAGLAWGLGLLAIGLVHDTRYKAFIQRLKRVRGRLHVLGGGGAKPTPQPPPPLGVLRKTAWLARKLCEAHLMMNLITAVALGQWLLGDRSLVAGRVYTALMAVVALGVAAWVVARSQRRAVAEAEFAAWYHVPLGHEMNFVDGWWHVQPPQEGKGDSHLLCKAPGGPFRQKVAVTFSRNAGAKT